MTALRLTFSETKRKATSVIEVRAAADHDAQWGGHLFQTTRLPEGGQARYWNGSAASRPHQRTRRSSPWIVPVWLVCAAFLRFPVRRRWHLPRLTSLVVEANARHRGIGRRLVESAEAWAMEQSCMSIQVSSGRRPERSAAHLLYPALLGYADAHSHHVLYSKWLHRHVNPQR